MTNPFKDQEKFMRACDQTVDSYNDQQFKLYYDLIAEEFAELNAAVLSDDRVEQLDALLDKIGRAHV